MTSRDTEGRREIQAARKRLSAAKLQASSAAKALESATGADDSAKKAAKTAKTMADMAKKNADTAKKNAGSAAKCKEDAQSQYDDSAKEVKEAEAFLKEAEERCEVVDVDSNDDKGLFDVDTDNEFNENEGRKKKKQKTGAVETIVVEGCGVPEANGTYKRSDELYLGVLEYHKEGKWKGKDARYRIYYDCYAKKWFICVGGRCWLYYAPETTDAFAEVPPEYGWGVFHYYDTKGRDPAPRLKLSQWS